MLRTRLWVVLKSDTSTILMEVGAFGVLSERGPAFFSNQHLTSRKVITQQSTIILTPALPRTGEDPSNLLKLYDVSNTLQFQRKDRALVDCLLYILDLKFVVLWGESDETVIVVIARWAFVLGSES
jgi:hypothetical protein